MNNSQPRHPVYIISKGRWRSRLTAKTFDDVGYDKYFVAVEPQEYELYADFIPQKNLVKANFMNLGYASIPIRNFCWQHSIENGATHHWCFDDNIMGLRRLHKNTRLKIKSAVGLRVIEDFMDKFENIEIAGMEYTSFAPSHISRTQLRYNARVYSNLLFKNDGKNRWRVLTIDGVPAHYQEDTDVCIRTMKDGNFTALFHQFLIDKADTHTVKGGNTSEVYYVDKTDKKQKSADNRIRFALCLCVAHPDIASIIDRAGRKHHLIDYSNWTNPGYLPTIKDEYKNGAPKQEYSIHVMGPDGAIEFDDIPGLMSADLSERYV